MSTNSDCLDDIYLVPVAKTAKAGGKFQPKGKPHPRKETSQKYPSTQPMQNRTIADNEAKKPSENNLDSYSGVHSVNESALVNTSIKHLIEETLVDNIGVSIDVVHVINKNTTAEGVSSSTELDSLGTISPEHDIGRARAGGKFIPKAKSCTRREISLELPPSQPIHITRVEDNDTESRPVSNVSTDLESSAITTVHVSETSTTVVSPFVPSVSTIKGATVGVSNTEDHITLDTSTHDEGVGLDSDGGYFFNNGVLEIEVETGPCVEGSGSMFDMTTQSGERSRKIQPKPKFHVDTSKTGTGNGTSHVYGSGSVSEYDYVSFQPDDFTSELLLDEGQNSPAEYSFYDASDCVDYHVGTSKTLEKCSKHGNRNNPAVPDHSLEQQEALTTGPNDEVGIPTRTLRNQKNTFALIDEDEDEAYDDGNFVNEHPSSSPREENDDAHQVESETQAARKSKKPKKSSLQNERPVRKRKEKNEVREQGSKKPRKIFSHSTRRTRRQVDKKLLETPEDDIDMRQWPIKDIILLAEHREREANKKGKKTDAPVTTRSVAGTSFTNRNDVEGDQLSNDQAYHAVQESSAFVNYHSYMKKTPRARWSEQDTELFYEAVRQFGADISMIQQLFPGRTREQVKLKYKKEERQQPLRLHEALINRSGDHSHFQRVIEQLQLAAQEKHNSFEDVSNDISGNGEETNLEENEEIEKADKSGMKEDAPDVEKSEKSTEPDAPEVESPVDPSYDSDDDFCVWSQYKSEL